MITIPFWFFCVLLALAGLMSVIILSCLALWAIVLDVERFWTKRGARAIP